MQIQTQYIMILQYIIHAKYIGHVLVCIAIRANTSLYQHVLACIALVFGMYEIMICANTD